MSVSKIQVSKQQKRHRMQASQIPQVAKDHIWHKWKFNCDTCCCVFNNASSEHVQCLQCFSKRFQKGDPTHQWHGFRLMQFHHCHPLYFFINNIFTVGHRERESRQGFDPPVEGGRNQRRLGFVPPSPRLGAGHVVSRADMCVGEV